VVDYDHVAEFIRQLCKRFDVKRVAFDPWGATQLATGLLREGVPMIEVRQGFRSLSEPSKKLEALVLSKKLRHPDNPLLNWAVSNTVIDQGTDAAGNIKPSKAASTERIDPVAALISALAGWMFQGEEHMGPSVYETKGIEWL
jgi:phage terminase large subunit-like protein